MLRKKFASPNGAARSARSGAVAAPERVLAIEQLAPKRPPTRARILAWRPFLSYARYARSTTDPGISLGCHAARMRSTQVNLAERWYPKSDSAAASSFVVGADPIGCRRGA